MKNISARLLLKKYSIRPKKSLGQNFLVSPTIVERIISVIQEEKAETIIEIGPGLGALTLPLIQTGIYVIAVEKDALCFSILSSELEQYQNLKLIHKDFMEFTPEDYCRQALVIGNLPYCMTAPIIFRLIDKRYIITKAILTIQREVAQRITAKPNCKEYGVLSVLVQVNCAPTKLFDIPPSSFTPKPKVFSSLIKLDFTQSCRSSIENYALFALLVKKMFEKRRKTIKNTMKSLLIDRVTLETCLRKAGLDPNNRPENLSISNFVQLSNILNMQLAQTQSKSPLHTKLHQ